MPRLPRVKSWWVVSLCGRESLWRWNREEQGQGDENFCYQEEGMTDEDAD